MATLLRLVMLITAIALTGQPYPLDIALLWMQSKAVECVSMGTRG